MAVVTVFDISGSVAAAIEAGVAGSVAEVAQEIAQEARDSIRLRSKSGRTYRRGGTTWRASAPGEPPANVTGALASSIEARSTGERSAEVVATGQMAHTMEFGTAGGKVAPRPFMVPAAEAKKRELEARTSAAIKRAAGG